MTTEINRLTVPDILNWHDFCYMRKECYALMNRNPERIQIYG